MSKCSLIYVLTNPDFAENEIKIGYSTDLAKRLKVFNTGAPKDYKVFCTYDVPNILDHKPDQLLHSLLLKLDPTLKVNPKKEFFYLYPEDAFDILESIALIHDRRDSLKLLEKYTKRAKASASSTEASTPVTEINTSGWKTYKTFDATLISDGTGKTYKLLKGSILEPWNKAKRNEPLKNKQDQLIESGGAAIINGKIVLQVDLDFKSPSGPAMLVHCCSINGWTAWKNDEGQSIGEVERRDTKI